MPFLNGFMHAVLLLALCAGASHAWQQWQWPSTTEGPSERFGHSFVLWEDKLVLFGGRANDIVVEHDPKTYSLEEVDGFITITTYDSKPVRNITCPANATTPEECEKLIDIADLYNDVWIYDTNCLRYADGACVNQGWEQLHEGARFGGCRIEVSEAEGTWEQICPVPFERYSHVALIHNFTLDGMGMLIYGGFAPFCEDYCADVWIFSFATSSWRQLRTHDNTIGPGKRWRFATTLDGSSLWLFGGHRLWHGFNPLNSVDNNWGVTTEDFPSGGYMEDLWSMDIETANWTQYFRRTECRNVTFPGQPWEERRSSSCFQIWPGRRAGAGLAKVGATLYVHGGYRTPFPYPNTGSVGASTGVNREPTDGISPYPTHPYYLADMWRYDVDTGLWRELTPTSAAVPGPRADHSLVAAGPVLYLFGGYSSNVYFDDTWQFNLSTNFWLEKRTFVHALYPDNCTDDTPEGSYSVAGEPTRFTPLDGDIGRRSAPLLVPQMRRRAPGWDGCRDRSDGRGDLEGKLLWLHPPQRAGHKALFLHSQGLLFIYGGRGFAGPVNPDTGITPQAAVRGDLWQFSVDNCHKNCSGRGTCHYGHCICDPGYYGVDCSNISCPGDYCHYDPNTLQQVCTHCCHATYVHEDGDNYTIAERKVPCGPEHPGESHGVCDGFGRCQCAPPYITGDCSVEDCPYDCSGHGTCNVEYPVSRCICERGWIGEICNIHICPNNCSYPNGVCNNGTCACSHFNNPYNRSILWRQWGLDDCSGVVVYAAGASAAPRMALMLLALAVVALLPAGVEQDPRAR